MIIGTHRLLSDDVKLKDLGLLVIDEEQRFGVQHKEKIKALRAHVDVLTLTATPIPRTLEMSLTGIRDLSLVQTPPEERQPILTYVGEYDDRAVSEAIRRELLREGQVFYVHNRVQDIEHVAAQVRELVPGRARGDRARPDGREPPRAGRPRLRRPRLRRARLHDDHRERPRHADGEHDGRRPRRPARARAAVPAPRPGRPPRAARVRVPPAPAPTACSARRRTSGSRRSASSPTSAPGSSSRCATSRSAAPATCSAARRAATSPRSGFDLYCELVTEAVGELKGEPQVEPFEVVIDVPVDAHLPREYVSRDDVRMEAYRRLAAVTTQADVDDVRTEWLDRYGPLPPPAEALLAVARLRAECVRVRATSVSVQKGIARIEGLELKESQKVRLRRLAPEAAAKEDGEVAIPLAVPADRGPRRAARPCSAS